LFTQINFHTVRVTYNIKLMCSSFRLTER